jgi:hypothetical protein
VSTEPCKESDGSQVARYDAWADIAEQLKYEGRAYMGGLRENAARGGAETADPRMATSALAQFARIERGARLARSALARAELSCACWSSLYKWKKIHASAHAGRWLRKLEWGSRRGGRECWLLHELLKRDQVCCRVIPLDVSFLLPTGASLRGIAAASVSDRLQHPNQDCGAGPAG